MRGEQAIRLLVVIAAVLSVVFPANAEARKVALVIGNALYENTTALDNPPNDARIVAGSAREAGFEVTLVTDLDNDSFQLALRGFRERADGADIAMIYYAGHAIEGQGRNWLIPTDALLETSYDLPYEAINLDRLLETLSGAQIRMLVLDSCRNNPLGNSWRRGVRAVPSGLAALEVDDFLVIYAAAPGQVAADGTDGNSPFALSLAKRLPEPGLPIQLLGGVIRDDVLAATGGRQRPFVSASITGRPVYLVGSGNAGSLADGSTNRTALEALAWQGASSSGTLAGYRTFLEQFPDGLFSTMARQEIAKLSPTGAQPAPAPGVVRAAPPPQPAEEATAGLVRDEAGSSEEGQLAALPKIDAAPPAPVTGDPAPGQLAIPLAELNRMRANARLPELPATPTFSAAAYPECREDFATVRDAIAKVDAINRCTSALDAFYAGPMLAYRNAMSAHQDAISALYTEKVGGNPVFTVEDQQGFFARMRAEHSASNPEGEHYAELRKTEQRYEEDRRYLAAQYCALAGTCE